MVTATAVITAAGKSTRLGPIGTLIPKGLLPLGSKRGGGIECAIDRHIASLRRSKITEVILVGSGQPILQRYAESWKLRVTTARTIGEFEAVATACGLMSQLPEMLIVVSSDNVFAGPDLVKFVNAAKTTEENRIAVCQKGDLRLYTAVETDASGAVVRDMVEKPLRAGPGLAKAGLYAFTRLALHSLLATTPRYDRFGERSMTEALRCLLNARARIEIHRLAGGFIDIGTLDGYAAALR